MSYARLGDDSSVYIYPTQIGSSFYLECCACEFGGPCYRATSTQQMVDHLAKHQAAGHSVPSNVVPELWADDTEWFPKEISL